MLAGLLFGVSPISPVVTAHVVVLAFPVWVEGVLQIEMADNVYGQAAYRLVGMKVTPYHY